MKFLAAKDANYQPILFLIVAAVLMLLMMLIGELIYRSQTIWATKCNGHAQLCDRPINEVAFASTHNSMSIADYDWFGPSHEHSITHQLDSGIRGLLIDTHYYDAVSSLSSYLPEVTDEQLIAMEATAKVFGVEKKPGEYTCHITCQLGYTPLDDTFGEIKSFLDDHRHEVIVMVIEDKISVADTEKSFQESGLDRYVYSYSPGDDWPTLRQLIRQNKRLVVMAEVAGSPPDWYLHAWDYTEETPYAYDSTEQLADVDYSCQPNRGDTGKPFFLLNNWVERVVPLRSDAEAVNDFDFLYRRASLCEQQRNQLPNLVAVNFSDYGEVMAVTNALNGVITLEDF